MSPEMYVQLAWWFAGLVVGAVFLYAALCVIAIRQQLKLVTLELSGIRSMLRPPQ